MQERKKLNKKRFILVLILLIGIGGVFAYFFNRTTFSNVFKARSGPVIITEEDFESPSDWVPGTTTTKTLDIINENDYAVGVRVKFDESWVSGNGDELSLYQCQDYSTDTCTEDDWTPLDDVTHNYIYGTYCVNHKVCTNAVKAAVINYSNLNKWKFGDDGYLYYSTSLAKNATAESPIASVTFNEDIIGDIECTTSNGTTNCQSSSDSYDGGTYTLKLTTEMIDYDNFDTIWEGVEFPYLYDKISNFYDSSKACLSKWPALYDLSDSTKFNYPVYYQVYGNIVFANHCWKFVRTTDTGGVKLLYNGEYDETEKCSANRNTHVGYNTKYDSTLLLSDDSYYYGTDYEYDDTNYVFKLSGTLSQVTYSGTNIDNIQGLYTCKSSTSTDTCATLYLVESYYSNDSVYVQILDSTSNYSEFGQTIYNRNGTYLYNVGYMYNNLSSNNLRSGRVNASRGALYGEDYSYDAENDLYTIVGNTDVIYHEGTELMNTNLHYTCFNLTGSCQKIAYIYLLSSAIGSGGSSYFYQYFYIENGENVTDYLNKNLYDLGINTYSSSIKFSIDKWYEHYMEKYAHFIEDTNYCQSRGISMDGEIEKWSIYFSDYDSYSDAKLISCNLITDKFSTRNEVAKLTYPVSLITSNEISMNYYSRSYCSDGVWFGNSKTTWWLLNPSKIDGHYLDMTINETNGQISSSDVYWQNGLRPAISLKPFTIVTGGSGTTTDPYIVE